jgi:predicted PurR-regulated permease PerM
LSIARTLPPKLSAAVNGMFLALQYSDKNPLQQPRNAGTPRAISSIVGWLAQSLHLSAIRMRVDALRSANPWIMFGGCVLVVFVLARMSTVLIPIAVATLFAFLLAPLVALLQRRVGRIAAVIVVVAGSTAVAAGLAALGLMEIGRLGERLPDYRDNIRAKVSDVRVMTQDGIVEKIEQLLDDVQGEIGVLTEAPEVVVQQSASDVANSASAIANPVIEVLVNAAIVFVLVIFMLFERQELRDRFMRVFGHNRVATTTKAIDEAGHRISRYLYAQLLVNTFYGVVVGISLYFVGLPHALLWGCLATVLRFVPYVGPWLAAVPPILLSLAVSPGWIVPIVVLSLYLGLELFTNVVLEPYLYSGVVGISQVGLLVAVLFWSWLWGPVGLLLAAPLTVCLVVIGRRVPAFRLFSELMTATGSNDAPGRYYQRLLAGDQLEAGEILREHIRANSSENIFDALMLPTLAFSERDVAAGMLDAGEESSVQKATAELLEEVTERRMTGNVEVKKVAPLVLVIPVNQKGDALASRMLADLLAETPIQLEIGSASSMHSEVVQLIRRTGAAVVCIADMPPSSSAKARYLVYRIRAAIPDMRIIVGRWGPPSLADQDTSEILAAGANYVTSTLAETRRLLIQMSRLDAQPKIHNLALSA